MPGSQPGRHRQPARHRPHRTDLRSAKGAALQPANRVVEGDRFHVLPTNGYAMYAPDVRAISDEARFGIRDLGDGARQARR